MLKSYCTRSFETQKSGIPHQTPKVAVSAMDELAIKARKRSRNFDAVFSKLDESEVNGGSPRQAVLWKCAKQGSEISACPTLNS